MIVLAGVESAVVEIQTFGAIWDGMVMSDVFLICSEHHEEMLAKFLAYKTEMQVGRFASSWKGVGMVQIVHSLLGRCEIGERKVLLPLFHL